MLIRLFKYLKGYVKIRVEGYSPERFLNLCNANGILLWQVEKKAQYYVMCISVKDYKRLRPFVRKTGTKIILLEKHGLPFFLYRFRKRKMFFAGMILCVVGIYILSLFVWNIHFEGNVTQNTEELLAYLETIGVKHGVLKSEIVCENIETNLRSQYPNMLWVSAEMRGTRIIVQIKENTDDDIISKVEYKDESAVSIVSDRAGIVDSIIVRQGTPLVTVGEEVTAGQILVEGFYEIKNDAGEVVRYEGVPADADIKLVAVEAYSDTFSMEYEKKRYTQKKRLGIKAVIFDKSYEFTPKIPFQNYETVENKKEFHVTENFYLPFSIECQWYLEYEIEKCLYTREEAKTLAEKRFQEKYENILQKGVQIIEKDVKIDTNGKLCHGAGTVKILVPVTATVAALIPEAMIDAPGEGEN